jgi:tRNA/rRNA methyltransferase
VLSSNHRDRIQVVLVRARNPSNIGAVARAMHDFGLHRLSIVNEYDVPFEGAKSAVDASEVLHAATTHRTVAEAVAGCTLVVGTTAVGERVLEHPLYILPDAAGRIATELDRDQGSVALLFGSEKTGLSNEELSHCHWLTTIPMHPHEGSRHVSMNLGQAAAVCLYELTRQIGFAEVEGANREPTSASAEETARIATLLHEVLEQAEYMRHHPANSDLAAVRRLLVRSRLTRDDAPVWLGMLRQVLWRLRTTR